jgi:hypothetical protein
LPHSQVRPTAIGVVALSFDAGTMQRAETAMDVQTPPSATLAWRIQIDIWMKMLRTLCETEEFTARPGSIDRGILQAKRVACVLLTPMALKTYKFFLGMGRKRAMKGSEPEAVTAK